MVASSAQIGPGAVVCPGAMIGEGVSVGAGSHVGEGVKIGDGSKLYPRVVVYPGCTIGARVILHSGVVIGADGFGLAEEEGRWLKIPQIGAVVLGDDVEIGANTTIDRGAIDDTVIGRASSSTTRSRSDTTATSARIPRWRAASPWPAARKSAVHALSAPARSSSVTLTIADKVHVSAATVISRSIHKAGTYTGMFPFDDNESWARNTALVRHLAELADRVKMLEKRLSEKEKKDA